MALRAYQRLDPRSFEKKVLEQGYPLGAFAAFIGVVNAGESQPDRGRFRSAAVVRALLGPAGRWVGYLVEHGDLVPLPDGRLYVDGWDEWQEGDWKVQERVARIRGRRKRDVTPPTVTPVTVEPVSTPSDGDRQTAAATAKRDSPTSLHAVAAAEAVAVASKAVQQPEAVGARPAAVEPVRVVS